MSSSGEAGACGDSTVSSLTGSSAGAAEGLYVAEAGTVVVVVDCGVTDAGTVGAGGTGWPYSGSGADDASGVPDPNGTDGVADGETGAAFCPYAGVEKGCWPYAGAGVSGAVGAPVGAASNGLGAVGWLYAEAVEP